MIALSLILLMGMAALAIDLGMGFNERRQDQSAADVGALAAAQFAQPIANAACNAYAGAALARSQRGRGGHGGRGQHTHSPGAANWSSGTECIARRCPARWPPTRPALLSIRTCRERGCTYRLSRFPPFLPALADRPHHHFCNAIAIASFNIGGRILPFLTPGIVGTGSYECLKTSGNPNWGVCQDLPSTGNFGSADYFVYGNEPIGSVTACSGGTNTRPRLQHCQRGRPPTFHPYDRLGTWVEERASCPIFSAEPNMLEEQTGVASNLDDGLTRGGAAHALAPYDGRIEDAGGDLVRNAQGPNPATVWITLRCGAFCCRALRAIAWSQYPRRDGGLHKSGKSQRHGHIHR